MYYKWHLFNVITFSLHHRLDTDPELGACLFLERRWELGEYSADGGDQAGFGVVGGYLGDVLDVWPNELVLRSEEEMAGERRVQSRSTPSEAKPEFLWTRGPALSPTATPRVCHRSPDCTRGSPHSSAHPGTRWCLLSSRLRRCEVASCGTHLELHQKP